MNVLSPDHPIRDDLLRACSSALEGATAIGHDCWYRPLDNRGRLVFRYPPNANEWPAAHPDPTNPPPARELQPEDETTTMVHAAAMSEAATGDESAPSLKLRGARVHCFTEAQNALRTPATPSAPKADSSATEEAKAGTTVPHPIGLPTASSARAGRSAISLQQEDLHLLLVAVGLTVLTRVPSFRRSADRLAAKGRVLIGALDSNGQAAVRNSCW